MKTTRKRLWKIVLISLLILILAAVSAAAIWFFVVYYSVTLDEDTIVAPSRNLVVTDSRGDEIPVNSALNKYVSFDEIGQNIVDAFVATEDKRFFDHNGVDYKRLVGAMVHNVQAGFWKEGGSTITQQLIKNTQLSAEKSLTRKVKEMRLAHQIEKKYSKEDIVEMYLNAIYFGNGIYGIDEACKQYFGKTPMEIDVAEAAVLAGVVKNPRKNSPLNSVENANARKNLVLRLMFEQNKIDEAEYDAAIAATVVPADRDSAYRPYSSYVDAVLNEASEILGVSEKDLIEGKYRVVTYLDPEAQEKLYRAYASGELLPANRNGSLPSYAALALHRESAGISMYVSDLKQSVFDFRRQPGSAIKPFLSYLPALEYGSFAPLTQVNDAPVSFGGYQPKNYHGSYLGRISLRDAVASSSNAVAVTLANDAGLFSAKALATRAGITFHQNDETLPIALGGMTEGVTLLELTGAYATIGNAGTYVRPSFVKAIFNRDGKSLYQRNVRSSQAFSKESAALMTDMLQYTVSNGTAQKLTKLGYPVAAKTGTVGCGDGGNNDAWCAAYTSENTVLSWYGNLSMKKEDALENSLTGGSYPAIVAAETLKAVEITPPKPFPIPYTVAEAEIDRAIYEETGEFFLVPDTFPEELKLKGLFRAENAPTLFSPNAVVSEPEGFDVTVYDCPYLRFIAAPNETYKIYRQSAGDEIFLREISETNGRVSLEDRGLSSGGGFVTYRIEVANRAGITENYYRSILYRRTVRDDRKLDYC